MGDITSHLDNLVFWYISGLWDTIGKKCLFPPDGGKKWTDFNKVVEFAYQKEVEFGVMPQGAKVAKSSALGAAQLMVMDDGEDDYGAPMVGGGRGGGRGPTKGGGRFGAGRGRGGAAPPPPPLGGGSFGGSYGGAAMRGRGPGYGGGGFRGGRGRGGPFPPPPGGFHGARGRGVAPYPLTPFEEQNPTVCMGCGGPHHRRLKCEPGLACHYCGGRNHSWVNCLLLREQPQAVYDAFKAQMRG